MFTNNLVQPPEDFNGQVDVECFWRALSMERIGHGFVTSNAINDL